MWTLVALATLIVLFYAEEDWRGARAWQAAQAEYARAGESLDFAKFIPPPIPDAQNLGALPLFAQDFYSKADRFASPIALRKALRQDEDIPQLPSAGYFVTGKPTDFAQLRQRVAVIYAAALKGISPPKSPLAQFEAVYPFIIELRNASATRTSCRFNSDYTIYPPTARPLGLLTAQLPVAQLLSRDALLAIDVHQPDVALADLRTIFILSSGADRDPSLVGKLAAMGMKSIAVNVIAQGLMLHAWNDPQLVQLQLTLQQTDFLSAGCAGLRSEAAGNALTYQYLKDNPSQFYVLLGVSVEQPDEKLLSVLPSGWINAIGSRLVLFHLGMLATIDPAAHRVYPERARRLWDDVQRGFPSIVHAYFRVAAGPVNPVSSRFAWGQTWIDQAILACALERFRLAHGHYPTALNALRPDYCAKIPTDVISGQPYHYRVQPDGSYRLYSVGWNGKDDGGILVYYKQEPYETVPRIDDDEGDWVWFGPK